MRGLMLIVVQLLVSFLLVGALMPIVLVTMPAVRGARVGLVLTASLVAVIFVLLRLVWPRASRY